jgi:hypothetical protein
MTFSFPNANPGDDLFFPTVHIHDGKVHAVEESSHTLYCQTPSGYHGPEDWEESGNLPASPGKTGGAGLVDKRDHVSRRLLVGILPNRDTDA